MDQWHYDPAAECDDALLERLRTNLRASGRLVLGVRTLVALVLRSWLRVYHRLTIVGRHNLPTDGPFLLIANHASHLDTLCLLAALPLSRLRHAFPVAARDYFCAGSLRSLLAKLAVNVLPFDRHFAPWESLGVCAHLLRTPDTVLIFFPEGTRAGSREPAAFKPGAALLAACCDVPVVPCHLAGTSTALPKGAWCPRPKQLRLTIGAPRVYGHLPATRESARQISQKLREEVLLLGHPLVGGDSARQPEALAFSNSEVP